MALKGMAESPAWTHEFFADHRSEIMELLFHDRYALRTAKRDCRPAFIEQTLSQCSNEELIDIFLQIPLFAQTEDMAAFREAYRRICLHLIVKRTHNLDTKEQFKFVQSVLTRARRIEKERVFILAQSVLRHAAWSPVSWTGQFLCCLDDYSTYDIGLLVKVLQEQIKTVLERNNT